MLRINLQGRVLFRAHPAFVSLRLKERSVSKESRSRMFKYIFLLPLTAIFLAAFQPDPQKAELKKELASLQKHYESTEKLRIRYEIRAYKNDADPTPIETMQMEMERIGKLYYINNSVMEQINTAKGQILLDHTNKLITVSAADTFAYTRLFSQFREIVQPDSFFNRFVVAFRTDKLPDGQKRFHLDYKNSPYKYIEISYDPVGKVIGKIRICYLQDPTGDKPGTQPAVEFVLNTSFSPVADAMRYDLGRYVNRKADKWVASPSYKNYRVLN